MIIIIIVNIIIIVITITITTIITMNGVPKVFQQFLLLLLKILKEHYHYLPRHNLTTRIFSQITINRNKCQCKISQNRIINTK